MHPRKVLGKDIPWGTVGLHAYSDRVSTGPKQLMAGSRKFKLEYLDRSDIVSLTPYAETVTGIQTLENHSSRVMPVIL
ncbi:MAG: hypothetical protein LLG16_04680 [Euryarchaeota archaeon]|nr:hypothetical protein [Euryarchaeota archaeon]